MHKGRSQDLADNRGNNMMLTRSKRPSIEIANSISELELLNDTMGGMLMMYEDMAVRGALLHSFADTFINVRGLDKETLISTSVKEHIANKRHELMWYFRKMGFTAKEIAAYFNRTVYSVTYACNKQDKIYEQWQQEQDELHQDEEQDKLKAIKKHTDTKESVLARAIRHTGMGSFKCGGNLNDEDV